MFGFDKFLRKVFGTQNERYLKTITPIVERINQLESSIQSLTDQELKAKTPYFKELIEKGESLDNLLPEAFAVVREAARRTIG